MSDVVGNRCLSCFDVVDAIQGDQIRTNAIRYCFSIKTIFEDKASCSEQQLMANSYFKHSIIINNLRRENRLAKFSKYKYLVTDGHH